MLKNISRQARKIYEKLIRSKRVNFEGLTFEEAGRVLDAAEAEIRSLISEADQIMVDLQEKRNQAEQSLTEIQEARVKLSEMAKGVI